jgi:hypothetical protein
MKKEVLEKLYAKEQKVDLGLADTITTEYKKVIDNWSKANTELSKAQIAATNGAKLYQESMDIGAAVLVDIAKMEKLSNEIGIPVPKPIQDMKTFLDSNRKGKYDIIGKVKDFSNLSF